MPVNPQVFVPRDSPALTQYPEESLMHPEDGGDDSRSVDTLCSPSLAFL